MDTTIQISNALKKELLKRKFFNKETYEEVIWDMIEDNQELSEQTKKAVETLGVKYLVNELELIENGLSPFYLFGGDSFWANNLDFSVLDKRTETGQTP